MDRVDELKKKCDFLQYEIECIKKKLIGQTTTGPKVNYPGSTNIRPVNQYTIINEGDNITNIEGGVNNEYDIEFYHFTQTADWTIPEADLGKVIDIALFTYNAAAGQILLPTGVPDKSWVIVRWEGIYGYTDIIIGDEAWHGETNQTLHEWTLDSSANTVLFIYSATMSQEFEDGVDPTGTGVWLTLSDRFINSFLSENPLGTDVP